MTATETLSQIETLARDVAINVQQVSDGLTGSLKGVSARNFAITV